MKWALSFGSLVCLALVLSPLDVTAQKGNKNNNGNTTPATPDDYKKLLTMKELTGTIVSADRSTIVLRIDIPSYAQPNNPAQPKGNNNIPRPNNSNQQNMQREMQQIQQDQARIQQLQAQMARANPQQRQSLQRQIQQAQTKLNQDMQQLQRLQAQASGGGGVGIRPLTPNQPQQQPNIVMNHKDFQLDIADNAAFRKKLLGTEYDNETGNLKVYTEAEKAKLKGTDPTKPGYAAKPEEMNAGAQVTVYFAAAAAPKKDAEGNVTQPKSTVRMVYMLTEGNPPVMIQGNAKKKAK